MKKIITLIIITLNVLAFSQSLTQVEKQAVINNLDSAKYWIREKAILDIITYKISESLPKLEQNIFTQEQAIAGLYLNALFLFNSNFKINFAHRFIDTIDNLKKKTAYYGLPDSWEIKRMKYEAASLLIKAGDLSRADIIIDWFDYIHPRIESGMPIQLAQILNNLPQYEIKAKNELLRIASLAEEEDYSSSSVQYLSEYYQSSIIPELLNIYINNNYDMTRLKILKYLNQFNYSDYENFLKQNFISDSTISDVIIEELLIKYSTPANFNFIITNMESALTPFYQNYYSYWIEDNYEPNPPQSLTNILEFLDYTNSLCDTLPIYAWLGDLTFTNELKNILTTAKANLLSGDSLTCKIQVKSFQDLVDNVYKDSLNPDPRFVTIEGWKFLYWNAQYILDRLPQLPIVINADIEVINPAISLVNPGAFTMEVKGSGFNSSSVVYFNGNARATSFVSDSTLNTQILSTDVSAAGNFPVWVSNGTTNSDTLIYKAVSALPQPVRPVLECVRNNGDGTYTAFFGYKNENTVSVYIPVGSKNKFTPNPQDRGQTRVFLPGRQYKVYTVNFNGSNLVWTLNGRTSTASRTSAPCK